MFFLFVLKWARIYTIREYTNEKEVFFTSRPAGSNAAEYDIDFIQFIYIFRDHSDLLSFRTKKSDRTPFLSLILWGKQIIALLLNAARFSPSPPIAIFTRPGFFFTIFSPRHCCIWFHDQVLISSPVHPHVPPNKKAFTDSLRFP